MRTQIVSCPHCGVVLLDDSSECHECGHVLDKEAAIGLENRKLPSDKTVAAGLEVCANCGETCRTGLVRCWNCSSFLRPEIEASYRRMRQSGRYEIERVELPIIDASHVSQQDSLIRRVSSPESFLSAHPYSTNDVEGGDDFELSDDSQFGAEDDDAFELNDELLLTDRGAQQADGVAAEFFALQSVTTETEAIEPSPASAAPVAQSESAEPPISQDASEPPAPSVTEGEAPPVAPEEELLKIAADEEKDIQRVRKTLRSKGTFVIFCPQGHRIRVKEEHRGKSGTCPKCQSKFVVPKTMAPKAGEGSTELAVPQVIESRYKKWMTDIRLHTVDPQKLRIKADSLFNECQAVDLGFSEDGLLVASLMAGKFGANPKKIPPLRQALLDHFQNQGTIETLTVPMKKVYTTELLGLFTLAQPTPTGTESLFADIPVFGTNRIAVRIPKMADDPHARYLSFCLSEFRAFVEGLETVCKISGFGSNSEIPMKDEYTKLKCHLKQTPILDLVKLNYYQKDPGFKLEVSGWKCAACGIVISEAARAETKLGGANGKAIAKAKCPKCTKKFGSLPLYQLAGTGSEGTETSDPAAENQKTEPATV
jgi:hypothetical protein